MNTNILGRRILVPLDGSPLAERALPAAVHVARGTDGELVLTRVLQFTQLSQVLGPGYITPELYREMSDEEERAASEYLDCAAGPLRADGLRVRTELRHGITPAAVLLDLEAELDIGLVVMTTHGRTGMARFALGSVADRLVHTGSVPVLLIRPFTDVGTCQQLDHAFVPLDGSPQSEEVLPLVEQLAGHLWTEITLARVVELGAEAADVEQARRYLDGVRLVLNRQMEDHDCSVARVVLRGDPADRIIQAAQSGCDVVIMATRGEQGTRRWFFGSVADRVLHDAAVPLLLVQSTPA